MRAGCPLRALTERSARMHVFEHHERNRERPAGDCACQQEYEPGSEERDDAGGGPELRRMSRKVEVDVVIAQQRQVHEASGEQKRHQPGKDSQDHVRDQAQYIQRPRRAESQSAPCVQGHALRRPEANGHQARGFQCCNGCDQRSAQDQRRDSRRCSKEKQRNIDVRHDPVGCPGAQPVQQQGRCGHERRKCEHLVSHIGDRQAAPRAAQVACGAREKLTDSIPHYLFVVSSWIRNQGRTTRVYAIRDRYCVGSVTLH